MPKIPKLFLEFLNNNADREKFIYYAKNIPTENHLRFYSTGDTQFINDILPKFALAKHDKYQFIICTSEKIEHRGCILYYNII